MKRLWSRNKAPTKAPEAAKDLKGVICYHCHDKGHFAKQCPKREAGKSMMATWDMSDEEEDESPTKEVCLMALGDDSSSEVNDNDVSSLLAKKTREQLYAIIEKLGLQISELSEEIDEKDEKIANLIDDNKVWSSKAIDLEKKSVSKPVDCSKCPNLESQVVDLQKQVDDLEKQVSSLEGQNLMLKLGNAKLSSDLENMKIDDEAKKQKWKDEFVVDKVQEVKQDFGRRFVKVVERPGLGYGKNQTEKGNASTSQTSKGKSPMHEHNASCSSHVVDPKGKGKQKWYPNQKVRTMWENQVQKAGPSRIDFQARVDNKPVYPGYSKYVGLKSHITCWYCGKGGHYQHECFKRSRDSEKARKSRTSRKKPKVTNPVKNPKPANANAFGNVMKSVARPRGVVKQLWVRKN